MGILLLKNPEFLWNTHSENISLFSWISIFSEWVFPASKNWAQRWTEISFERGVTDPGRPPEP